MVHRKRSYTRERLAYDRFVIRGLSQTGVGGRSSTCMRKPALAFAGAGFHLAAMPFPGRLRYRPANGAVSGKSGLPSSAPGGGSPLSPHRPAGGIIIGLFSTGAGALSSKTIYQSKVNRFFPIFLFGNTPKRKISGKKEKTLGWAVVMRGLTGLAIRYYA